MARATSKKPPRVVTPALSEPVAKRVKKTAATATPVPVYDRASVLAEAADWLAQGKTLAEYCRQPQRPDRRTITRWIAEEPAMQALFTEARAQGYDMIAEGCIALADAPIERDAQGRRDMALVAQRKLQIETRLKLLSKWATKYGDRVEIAGDPNAPLQVQHSLSPEDRAAKVEELLERARLRRKVGEQNAPPRPVITVEVSKPETDPAAKRGAFVASAQARFKPRLAAGAHDRLGVSASATEFIVALRAGNEILRIERHTQTARFVEQLLQLAGRMPIVVDVDPQHTTPVLDEVQRRGHPGGATNGAHALQQLVNSDREIALPPGEFDDAALHAIACAFADVQLSERPEDYAYVPRTPRHAYADLLD